MTFYHCHRFRVSIAATRCAGDAVQHTHRNDERLGFSPRVPRRRTPHHCGDTCYECYRNSTLAPSLSSHRRTFGYRAPFWAETIYASALPLLWPAATRLNSIPLRAVSSLYTPPCPTDARTPHPTRATTPRQRWRRGRYVVLYLPFIFVAGVSSSLGLQGMTAFFAPQRTWFGTLQTSCRNSVSLAGVPTYLPHNIPDGATYVPSSVGLAGAYLTLLPHAIKRHMPAHTLHSGTCVSIGDIGFRCIPIRCDTGGISPPLLTRHHLPRPWRTRLEAADRQRRSALGWDGARAGSTSPSPLLSCSAPGRRPLATRRRASGGTANLRLRRLFCAAVFFHGLLLMPGMTTATALRVPTNSAFQRDDTGAHIRCTSVRHGTTFSWATGR